MTIDIRLYRGNDLVPEIGILGEFRLRYFHEFPYLYVGMEESEQGHLAGYSTNPSSRFFVARDEKKVAGIGIGTLLSTEKDILEPRMEAFRQYGLDPADFFYFGEMIFAPKYRGCGIGRRMLDMLKTVGTDQGATRFCFLAVDRNPNDPRRPPNHVDSTTIFQKFGFRKTPIQTFFEWPTIQANGSVEKTTNPLSLWID